VAFDENLQNVKLKSAGVADKDGFTFDRVFPMETKQHEVFEYGVQG
jgi:kinesin family protein 5